MKLKDITVFGATESQVRRKIKKFAYDIRELARRIPIGPLDDFVGWFAQKALLYSVDQLIAASKVYPADIQAFAWRTRNLFEADLILRLIIEYPEKAKTFVAQKGTDEKEILQGIMSLSDNSTAEILGPIRNRSAHIEAVLETHDEAGAKYFHVQCLQI